MKRFQNRSLNFVSFSVFCLALGVTQSACAAEVHLKKASDVSRLAEVAQGAATQAGYADVKIFKTQIFEADFRSGEADALIPGRGRVSKNGRENATCFIALARGGVVQQLLPTVGVDDWEMEACLSVQAVGVLNSAAPSNEPRLALIYQAASPNAETVEPVVVKWNSSKGVLEIDSAASNAASLAGAKTIGEVRKAVSN